MRHQATDFIRLVVSNCIVRSQEISIDVGGKEYVGHFIVSEGMITVSGPDGTSTPTQVGNTPVQSLARLILSEIAGKARLK